jgi:hypothetical protein
MWAFTSSIISHYSWQWEVFCLSLLITAIQCPLARNTGCSLSPIEQLILSYQTFSKLLYFSGKNSEILSFFCNSN